MIIFCIWVLPCKHQWMSPSYPHATSAHTLILEIWKLASTLSCSSCATRLRVSFQHDFSGFITLLILQTTSCERRHWPKAFTIRQTILHKLFRWSIPCFNERFAKCVCHVYWNHSVTQSSQSLMQWFMPWLILCFIDAFAYRQHLVVDDILGKSLL